MDITAALVKELRDLTSAGMMDCKKALEATGGDVQAAIEEMRKSGQIKAAKKAGRVAAEGVIVIAVAGDNKSAVILEVNSETDFVSRGDDFTQFAHQVAERILATGTIDLDLIAELTITEDSSTTIEQQRQTLVAKLGENIHVRRAKVVSSATGQIGAYVHGQRIGVIVELEGGNSDIAKDIAMHIVASNPEVIRAEEVSQDRINTEKEIFTATALESGKPADIVEKMVDGRIKKFVNEISLVGQEFVKDPSVKVADYLKANNAQVVQFVRFEVGEGIEKKVDNFAEEVMAQVRGE